MIRKPTSPLPQDSAAIGAARRAAATGQAAVRAGGHSLRGLVCFAFAGIWGFAALAAGASGSLPTFIGVGLMALVAGWGGMRAFRNATASVQAVSPGSSPHGAVAPARRVFDGTAPSFGRRQQPPIEPGGIVTARMPMFMLASLSKRLLILAGIAFLVFGIGKTANAVLGVKPDARPPVFNVKTGDAEMDAAHAKAKATLGAFWASLDAKPKGERNHSLKVRFPISGAKNGATAEHMWVNDVSRVSSGKYAGRLDNVPEQVSDYRIGQTVNFTDDMISDWMFVRNGKIVGNHSMRPLLARMPPDKAAPLRAMLETP